MIAKLRTGDIAIGEEERQWLAAFIALQMVRGPALRDQAEAMVAAIGTNMLRAKGRRPEAFARLFREVPGIKNEDKTPEKVEELARMAAEPEKHFKIVATPHASLLPGEPQSRALGTSAEQDVPSKPFRFRASDHLLAFLDGL